MKKRPVCYYAHCLALYNTKQEARDVALLERLGYVVCNPNQPAIDATVKRWKAKGWNYMDIFQRLIATKCQVFAFRGLADGSIPAGVHKEIGFAKELQLPIFELPSSVARRGLTVEQTKEYIEETGWR